MQRTTIAFWLMSILACVTPGACSSDDPGAGDAPAMGGDSAVADVGAPRDQAPHDTAAAVERGIDLSVAPDQSASPDAGSDAVVGGFSLDGVVRFAPAVGCVPGAPDKDCQGALYVAITETPPLQGQVQPVWSGVVQGVKDADAYAFSGIPSRPSLYLIAFVDDNANADPANPAPDRADPVHADIAPFSAQPGEIVVREITFSLRLP